VLNEILSLAEIRRQFDSEWILVIEPELTCGLEVVRGQVAWHSKDCDEVYRKAREFAPTHSAILYTGRLPENVAVAL
jgi:hypothetical protein